MVERSVLGVRLGVAVDASTRPMRSARKGVDLIEPLEPLGLRKIVLDRLDELGWKRYALARTLHDTRAMDLGRTYEWLRNEDTDLTVRKAQLVLDVLGLKLVVVKATDQAPV